MAVKRIVLYEASDGTRYDTEAEAAQANRHPGLRRIMCEYLTQLKLAQGTGKYVTVLSNEDQYKIFVNGGFYDRLVEALQVS